jgi:hypothetical protein
MPQCRSGTKQKIVPTPHRIEPDFTEISWLLKWNYDISPVHIAPNHEVCEARFHADMIWALDPVIFII